MARTKKGAGAAGLLDDATHDVIVTAIKFGFTWKDAATRAGISERIIHYWRQRGSDALDAVYDALEEAGADTVDELTFEAIQQRIPELERRYARLASDLAKANLDAKMNALAQIHKHMVTDWRAASWFLERRFPDEFGAQAIRLTADVTSRNVNVDVDPEDTITLSAIIAAMSEVKIGGTE